MIGRQLGPYRLLERLGMGGEGIVFLGARDADGERAAVKLLRHQSAASAAAICREIRILARISHPQVIRILDHGIAQGSPWYATPYVQGDNLVAHVRRSWHPAITARSASGVATTERHLPAAGGADLAPESLGRAPDSAEIPRAELAHVLRLVRLLCGPLAHLHGEGIVHRDIKPGNILVTREGLPILLDFGLVARFPGAEGREALDDVAPSGTISYMAPEQIRGDLVDPRADLYALGCVLYELIAGRPPFRGSADASVIKMHLTQEPLPLSRLVSGVGPELDELVRRLLVKRASDRLGYAEDVAVLLGALEGTRPTEPPEPPRGRPYVHRSGFVGRGEALQVLHASLDRADYGNGQLLLVGGESGAGKTRTLLELARAATRRGFRVLAAHCDVDLEGGEVRHPAATAASPIGTLLGAIADQCRAVGTAPAALLGRHAAVLAQLDTSLAERGAVAGTAELELLPPQFSRIRLLAALGAALEKLAERQPLLFLVDDLQWADELTVGFASYAHASGVLESIPCVLACAYRTEECSPQIAALLGAARSAAFVLNRLQERDVESMVKDILAVRSAPPDLAAYVWRQSEGNPLFVAEYLRTAVEEALLVRPPGGAWSTPEITGAAGETVDWEQAIALPRTLRELLSRRLRTLSIAARRLVDVLAVCGREADVSLLVAAGGMADSEVSVALAEARRRHLLEDTPAPATLRFAHDKIREVALAELDNERRRAFHFQVAEELSRRLAGGEQVSELALARHWAAGGEPERARPLFLAAAAKATQRYALSEGEAAYEGYLALALDRPVERAAALLDNARRVQMIRGRMEKAREMLEASIHLAREHAADELAARGLGALGSVLAALGEVEAAREAFSEALASIRRCGNRDVEGQLLHNLAKVHVDAGELDAARELCHEALAIQRGSGNRSAEAVVLSTLGVIEHEMGAVEAAAQLNEDALRIHRALGNLRCEALLLNNLGVLAMEGSALEKARELLGRALALARRVADRTLEAETLESLATCLLELGLHREGAEAIQGAVAAARGVCTRHRQLEMRARMAEIANAAGNPEEAGRVAGDAAGEAREAGNERAEALALCQVAIAAAARGREVEVDGALQRLLALLPKLADRRLVAQVLLAAARAARVRDGGFERAGPWAEEAHRLFAATGQALYQALAAGIATAAGRPAPAAGPCVQPHSPLG
ncbi:MAG: protein kinase [Candidatus Schekmanbacteria bacterium]|nr:protein kinase [Candidatus Schekmanbacteria bacterium]